MEWLRVRCACGVSDQTARPRLRQLIFSRSWLESNPATLATLLSGPASSPLTPFPTFFFRGSIVRTFVHSCMDVRLDGLSVVFVIQSLQDLLRPFLLACNHADASPHLMSMAMGSIQYLINRDAILPSDAPNILRYRMTPYWMNSVVLFFVVLFG